MGAVGQLSLNEDEQVRYHGKASGLYLLGINTKEEARNEGGIWQVLAHLFVTSSTDIIVRQAVSKSAGLASTSAPGRKRANVTYGYWSVLRHTFKQDANEC